MDIVGQERVSCPVPERRALVCPPYSQGFAAHDCGSRSLAGNRAPPIVLHLKPPDTAQADREAGTSY